MHRNKPITNTSKIMLVANIFFYSSVFLYCKCWLGVSFPFFDSSGRIYIKFIFYVVFCNRNGNSLNQT